MEWKLLKQAFCWNHMSVIYENYLALTLSDTALRYVDYFDEFLSYLKFHDNNLAIQLFISQKKTRNKHWVK